MSTKMKGLLKGLRYISQIFENEKDQEIQIGYPTDVKHVAHIGWDGPSSANSAPSWMNEFRSPLGSSSAPLGDPGNAKEDNSVKWSSEELTRRGGSVQSCDSPARDLPELPRSSRRQSSSSSSAAAVAIAAASSVGSPTRLKSEKSRQSRRSSKGAPSPATDSSTALGSSSPARPDIPKKTRRKKSKESSVGGGSSRSSTRSSKGRQAATSLADEAPHGPFSDPGCGSGLMTRPEISDHLGQGSRLGGGVNMDEKAISRVS